MICDTRNTVNAPASAQHTPRGSEPCRLFLDRGSKSIGSSQGQFTYKISAQKIGAGQKQRNGPVWSILGQFWTWPEQAHSRAHARHAANSCASSPPIRSQTVPTGASHERKNDTQKTTSSPCSSNHARISPARPSLSLPLSVPRHIRTYRPARARQHIHRRFWAWARPRPGSCKNRSS